MFAFCRVKSYVCIVFTSVAGGYCDDGPTNTRCPRNAVQCAVQSGNKSVVFVVGLVEPPSREKRAEHEDYRNDPTGPYHVLIDKHYKQNVLNCCRLLPITQISKHYNII